MRSRRAYLRLGAGGRDEGLKGWGAGAGLTCAGWRSALQLGGEGYERLIGRHCRVDDLLGSRQLEQRPCGALLDVVDAEHRAAAACRVLGRLEPRAHEHPRRLLPDNAHVGNADAGAAPDLGKLDEHLLREAENSSVRVMAHGAPAGECVVCYEDLAAETYVEYRVAPDAPWLAAKFCEPCVLTLLDTKFEAYMSGVASATCKAELRRYMARGPPVYLEDPTGFKVEEGAPLPNCLPPRQPAQDSTSTSCGSRRTSALCRPR